MKRYQILITHILFWIFVIAIRIPMVTRVEDQSYYIGILILSMFLHAIIFYLFYFIFSQILLKKYVLIFVTFFVVFLILYSIPVTYFFDFAFSKLMVWGFIKTDPEPSDFLKTYISVITSQSFYAIFGTLFRFTIDWFQNSRRQEELKKQNLTNELALLRSQINPHFLFNTLNNIHSFVYRDQDKTAYSIIKLSEIMRYMLYETDAERVFLEKEITYIENYIELQKLRFKDPSYVNLQIEGNISGKKIPPLLLITLVENAFKHGKKTLNKPGILILLKIQDNSLIFEVTNYITSTSQTKTEHKGFGLQNLEKRLNLIYGTDYHMEIIEDKEKHIVKLYIKNL
jgi:two-component system, LytTR family, sensor kinase